VRLGFSVAAHLEPEILIVDEVLAVGDAEFQKKCLGKMNDVSKNEGRTILFVSHNLGAVKGLCEKGLLLKKGMSEKVEDINSVISEYSKNNENEVNLIDVERSGNQKVSLKSFFFQKKEIEVFEDICCEMEVFLSEKI